MRRLCDITREEYLEILEKLRDMSIEYKEKVNYAVVDFTNGDPSVYSQIYFKLFEHFQDFRGKTIIEIGSGPGYLLNVLSQMGAKVYAVDKEDYGVVAEPNGIRFCPRDILDLPDNPRPEDLFPEVEFDEFDVLVSRLFIEPHVLQEQERAETILKKLRPLSKVHIHETTEAGYLFTGKISPFKIGYISSGQETSPFGIGNPMHTLYRINNQPQS